jgi:hypothetical protein
VYTKERLTGTTADDQRSCTGCSCNAAPCDVELDLWTHPACQSHSAIAITGSCAPNPIVDGVKAYKSKTTSGCTPATPSMPEGAIVFSNERTICCQ